MKKPQLNILVTVTAVFAAFVIGFFLGRNYNHTDIQLSAISPAEAAQPAESTESQPAARTSEETGASEATESPTPADNIQLQTETSYLSTEPPQTETGTPPETEPHQNETELPPETQSPVSNGLININTATRAQLETLPGIGEVLAQRIIDYRDAYGPFTTVTQLTNVSGIGDKRLAAIIDLVTVE